MMSSLHMTPQQYKQAIQDAIPAEGWVGRIFRLGWCNPSAGLFFYHDGDCFSTVPIASVKALLMYGEKK